jgi:hypothetical protein
MNRDDIIKMALEAGFSEAWLSAGENPPHFEAPAVIVERFFHMAQAAEREACAKAVLAIANHDAGNPYKQALRIGAEAIRARGNQ